MRNIINGREWLISLLEWITAKYIFDCYCKYGCKMNELNVLCLSVNLSNYFYTQIRKYERQVHFEISNNFVKRRKTTFIGVCPS